VSARFCEVCRYDFVAGQPGPAPRAADPAKPAAPPPAAAPPAASAPLTVECVLVIETDASLDDDPDPAHPCPTDQPPVSVPVDRPELLVGRRDDVRDVHPDISLNDPGTSRRHAKFLRGVDGSLTLQDLASTNGSKLNGVEVVAGSRSPLRVGDEVTLGRWTRIRVTAKS
jgi:hypothetical protein